MVGSNHEYRLRDSLDTLPLTLGGYSYCHAGHLSAGWVGPMGGHRDEAYLPVALVLGLQISGDSQQPRILALVNIWHCMVTVQVKPLGVCA